MPHFVYMLRCAGNRIYTGYAVDVEARFKQHVSGKGARFTKAFPPECVLRFFELETKGQALRLEARIKKLSRPQKELLASGLGGAADGVAQGAAVQGAAAELLEKLLAGLDKTLKKPRKKKVDPIASLQGDAKD